MAKNGAAQTQRSAKSGRFITVDKAYVKKQAGEAVTTFFAPVSGAWKATKGAGEPKGKPAR